MDTSKKWLLSDILALPLKATKVILLDDHYIGGHIVTNHWQGEPVREIVEELERHFNCREHSLRALRLDILRDPDEWEGKAKEFDLGWRQRIDGGLVVVHDVSLLSENLRRTPLERFLKMQSASLAVLRF